MDWDVPHEVYGAATYIFGTLVSLLFVALLIAVPIGIGAALCLTEVAPNGLPTYLVCDRAFGGRAQHCLRALGIHDPCRFFKHTLTHG